MRISGAEMYFQQGVTAADREDGGSADWCGWDILESWTHSLLPGEPSLPACRGN